MGFIPQEIIDKINSRADLVEVIRGENIELKKTGTQLVACCPFHEEKTPSFHVNPTRGMYKCFGCGKGGRTAIRFLQDYKHISFPEACKELAGRYGIEIVEEQPSEETIIKRKKAKARLDATKVMQEFFMEQLWPRDKDGKPIEPKTQEAKEARLYVAKRWGKELAEALGIGYAPSDFGAIPAVAAMNNISFDILKRSDDESTLGIIYEGKDHQWGSIFRNRIMIPLHDENGDVRGWSGRTMGNDSAKYKNSANCKGFLEKSQYIFNFYTARKAASAAEKIYMVEGAPNVLRCMIVGLPNTIASNGGEWTDEHIQRIAKLHVAVCFIPDSDLVKDKNGDLHATRLWVDNEYIFGVGFNKVIKAAKKALKLGIDVSVKPLPFTDDEGNISSRDADDYFTSEEVFRNTPEIPFIEWFADITYNEQEKNSNIRHSMLQRIADVIALIKDEKKQKRYIQIIEDKFGKRNTKGFSQLVKDTLIENKRIECKRLEGTQESTLERYGFTMEGTKGYYGLNDDGKLVRWSNFIARPKYLVRDSDSPRRLFELENFRHEKEMLDINIESIVSLVKFKAKLEGLGNFIWIKGQSELDRVKNLWYDNTENAFLINQLGWQKKGFYAYGNGALYEGEWYPTNEEGMIKLEMEDGRFDNFYVPSASAQFIHEKKYYEFEKSFVYIPAENGQGVRFRDYCCKMREVFGDKAMVGIAFVCACCFYDIMTRNGRKMPLLNLFGPKGSGKSEFAEFLTSFFSINYKPPHLNQVSDAALSTDIGRVANAVVHIDEFRNDIDVRKREMLKQIWDGKGREKMSMDKDRGAISSSVDSGVIISGQEMATADIALFSRFVFLTFEKSQFSREEKERFMELKRMLDNGITHLSKEILVFRNRFEARFPNAYNEAKEDVYSNVDMFTTENRIVDNWIMPLAAFRSLDGILDFPYSYKELLDYSIEGIKYQNSTSSTNNEIGKFWNLVMSYFTSGKIYDKADFKICIPKKPFKAKLDGKDILIDATGKRVLFMQLSQITLEYSNTASRNNKDNYLSPSSLPYYLEHSPEYMGRVRRSSFWKINRNTGQQEMKRGENNTFVGDTIKTSCMLFDYNALVNHYEINLEVFGNESLDPDENEAVSEDELPF